MKIKIWLAFLLIPLFENCDSKQEDKNAVQDSVNQKAITPDFNIALQFINDYTKYCLLPADKKMTDTSWIRQNSLLTENFKDRYIAIVDSAWKADKELGLGADPIFDAQDFPDKGFSISRIDAAGGYVTVVGNEWKDFELTLRVSVKDDRSLVDGAGIINIPVNKKAKR